MTSFSRLAVATCGRVYIVAVAHLLWIAGALAGGVVLGVGPASVAVRGAARAGLAETSARSAAREFARRYRAAFWRTAPSWLVLQLAGAAIIVATLAGAVPPGVAGLIVRAALLSGAIVVGMCTIMWSSADEALELPASPLRAIRTVTLYAVARFPLTLVTALAYAASILAAVQLPALLVILGPALITCVLDPLEMRSVRWNSVPTAVGR